MTANAHVFDATRTSPFGYYATCRCGWTSPAYTGSHEAAWQTWVAHSRAAKGGALRVRLDQL